MDKDFKKVIFISFLFLVFGGLGALLKFWAAIAQVFCAIFPIFGKKVITNYLTSSYFIVGIILAVLSSFGIWLGWKSGKFIYAIVSLITLIASAVSIASNLL